MEWKYTEKETPLTYKTGDWDGRNSDQVIAEDSNGRKHLAYLCEGTLDGTEFTEWYSESDYEIIAPIVRWLAIPE